MEENQNSAVESMELEVPTEKYKDTDLFLFNWLHKQKSGDQIFITQELKGYVDIYFEQIFNKWTDDSRNHQTLVRYEARNCAQADFGDADIDKEHFEAWNGYSIICPVFDEG